MVKLRKPFLVAACFVLISGFCAFHVSADDWNKATIITTNVPIEVPGRILPAGRYMFKLMDSVDRHVVQIMSDDQTKLYQTVLSIPDYRQQATDNAAITFYERPQGSVSQVHEWFYAGERSGVEFIYPKQRGALLAAVTTSETVPPSEESAVTEAPAPEAAITKAEPAPATLEKPEANEPVAAAEPESEVAEIAELEGQTVTAPEAAPATEQSQSSTQPSSLPRTASPDALFLLIGLGSGIAAYGARRLRS
jgi:hypothetical protein